MNFVFIHSIKNSLAYGQSISADPFESFANLEHQDDFYHQYGLHLPIAFNTWPFLNEQKISKLIQEDDPRLLEFAPYILPVLSKLSQKEIKTSLCKLVLIGQRHRISSKHSFEHRPLSQEIAVQLMKIESWLLAPENIDREDPLFSMNEFSFMEKIKIGFCETRIYKYFSKMLKLDFGVLRGDSNQKVVPAVLTRLKSSLFFLILPLIFTFIFSQIFGLVMAFKQRRVVDMVLSALFIAMYAIPLYIMIPLIIEKIGLRFNLPIHGIGYKSLTHLILPFIALSYGALAIYSRLHKALYLNLLSQEHLLCAKARGVSRARLIFVHTLRQSILTSIPLFLGSFSFFMGSLVIVETLFEVDGFGSFFYQSILQHDYNVTLFCILTCSILSMLGYLLSDLFLYRFDPRIRHHGDQRVF
ncbi:MAG: hypothetical protein S4CHLAM6_15940 [Chlamydiae bacterium]|nr:hypothetical protein [Chlamydiota bacterium]